MRGNAAVLEQEPAWTTQEQQFAADVEQHVHASDIQEGIAQLEALANQPRRAVPEASVLKENERALTEVDNLNRHRLPDGTLSPWVLSELLKNLIPYVKEGGMPSAISNTYQEFVANYEDQDGRRNTFLWLGRTAIQVARSGYAYHKHWAARERVGVEIEEAWDGEKTLRPGIAKVFLSPRMSEADASSEVAKAEHLGNDDALRISWLDVDEHNRIKGKHLESALVSDIPLQAWVDMLANPSNIFGKAIMVENPNSALSVMKTFPELELRLDALPEGVVTLVAAVLPYVKDTSARASVERQLAAFREDQAGKHEKAVNIAHRWLDFEIALADSLHQEWATPEIETFVNQLQNEWNDEDLALIASLRQPDGSLALPQHLPATRQLAARIEEAKRHFLLVSAAVVSDSPKVLEQLDTATAERIRDNELRIQKHQAAGQRHQAFRLEAQNQQIIAYEEITVEGGCPGDSVGNFRKKEKDENDRSKWETKKGVCVVKTCPTRPDKVEVGPCGVCMDRCQVIYDDGGDPTEGAGIVLKTIIRPTDKSKNGSRSLTSTSILP